MNKKTQHNQASANLSVILALAIAFSSLSGWAQAPGKTAEQPERIEARVNGEPVTQSELKRMLSNPPARQQILQELGNQNPGSKELERLAVRKLIHRRLILQEAGRRNFTVTEKDLDEAINSIRRRFEDIKDFGKWMKDQGLQDKLLFDAVRDDMLAARVRAALVEGVRLTDEQVRQYYDSHKDDLKTEEVRLQIIVVKDKATAEQILTAAIKKREDFGRLAQQRSLGRRAAQGGDTGWVDSETLWPALRQAVGTLKTGEATGPLERDAEFLLVRLHERRAGRRKSLAEARPEIERRLLPAKQQEAVQTWLAHQEQKSKIEVGSHTAAVR